MNSAQEIYFENKIQDLKNIVSCQKEEICKLKKKVETFNEVVNERDSLKELHNDFEQWKEKNKSHNMKVFNELKATCDDQAEKLRKSKAGEFKCEAKYNDLLNVNDCINNQLKNVKSNEKKLHCKLEDSENKINCVQKELCSTKSELEDKNCLVKKLNTNLKTNEEELCKVRKQYDESIKENNRLNEMIRTLKIDLNCTKTKLDDTLQCASCAEEKFKIERETLCNELKNIIKKLSCMEKHCDEANQKVNEEKCNIKKLVSTLIELREASLKNTNNMRNQIRKLKEENCNKEDQLCRLKKKVKQLQRDATECSFTEINDEKNNYRNKDCQLKQLKILSEKIGQMRYEIEANNMKY